MLGYDRILNELKRRGDGKPELAEVLPLYVALLLAQARADVGCCDSAAIAHEATQRLERGLSILAPESFQPDPAALIHLSKQVCAVTAQHRPELAEQLTAIAGWLDEGRLSILTLATGFLREGRIRAGEENGLVGSLLAYVFNNALHPFLRRYAKTLARFVDQSVWYRPHCPICDGETDLAALERGTGARRLLCSRCDFEWAFWRVACPFCGDDEPEQQKYAVTEDHVYRLYTCDKCKRYLKAIDLREVPDERVLPAERILTLPMDLSAREAGYSATAWIDFR